MSRQLFLLLVALFLLIICASAEMKPREDLVGSPPKASTRSGRPISPRKPGGSVGGGGGSGGGTGARKGPPPVSAPGAGKGGAGGTKSGGGGGGSGGDVRPPGGKKRNSTSGAKPKTNSDDTPPDAPPDDGSNSDTGRVAVFRNATLLFPVNAAAFAMSIATFRSEQVARMFTYHAIRGAYKAWQLKALPINTRLPTMEGSFVTKVSKVNSSKLAFKGKGDIPVRVVLPDMYEGEDMYIHGTDSVLVPPSV
ncbi:unnamed protein product [Closterium sp. Yama58-4]|nr:unnamed protein product [Closterium sp. Yama58-4]